MQRVIALVAALAAAACSKTPAALDTCGKLATSGVASNCRGGTPGGLASGAKEAAEFDLPSVPGHGGAVYTFDSDEVYDRTVEAFSKAAALAGPHRYGNRKARTFVQMNDGASAEVGKKAKDVVDGL